jgi:glycosyltransferase involved in cell wall biosynthesis
VSEAGPVDVVILTYNEERHIMRAIRSVAAFARCVYVVDSHSTDRTLELARAEGAQVVQHEFVHQAQQFQWALDTLTLEAPWTMRLDADEVVEPELAREIVERLPGLPLDVTGINLKRKHIFLGRWVKHGGRYPLWMLRIWRRGAARVEDRWMDEHMLVRSGRTIAFRHDFADWNLQDLGAFTEKHNRYATREAVQVLGHRLGLFAEDRGLSASSASWQASVKRVVKERLYNRLPFTWSAPAYFLWRYFAQAGFLDGSSGLVYHFLQGGWYRFLVGAKVLELERAVEGLDDRDEILSVLERQTGLRLTRLESSA